MNDTYPPYQPMAARVLIGSRPDLTINPQLSNNSPLPNLLNGPNHEQIAVT